MSLTNPLGQTELSTEAFEDGTTPHFSLESFDERGRLFQRFNHVGKLNNNSGDNCWRKTTYLPFQGTTGITAEYVGSDCTTTDNATLLMSRSYDSQGKLRRTQDADNKLTKYWYDAVGNPYIITDAANNPIKTKFDDLGRKLQVSDPNMGAKTFTYNSFGEVFFEQDAEQLQYQIDQGNNVEIGNYSFYDSLGRNTSKFWNVTATQEPLSDQLSYQDSSVYGGCGSRTAVCDVFRYSNFGGATAYTDGFFANQHKSYWYDSFGRMLNESVTLVDVVADLTDLAYGDGEFSTDYHYYENYNLLKQTIYKRKDQGIYSVVNHYDVFGQLRAQYANPSSHLLMDTNHFNFRGQPESRTLYSGSNSATTYYDYYANGQIKAIDHGSLDGAQTFDYEYDAWGNISAQMLNGSVNEVFKYDGLQRITSSWVGNVPANKITYKYDAAGLGNLIKKSDYSDIQSYGNGAGPNAITSAVLKNGTGTLTYNYDAKGNRIEDGINDGSVGAPTYVRARYHYDANNLLIASTRAESFENGGMEEAMYFRYGVDQQRFLKVEETTNTDDMTQTKEATIYAGPHFEEVINLERIDKKELKLQVNDYLTLTVKGNNHMEKHFMQKDRLGSTTRILDQDMALVKTMSYDVFGKPRKGDDWLKMTSPELDFSESDDANEIDITKRGFTDHEHLDNFELIHMNGRMYDFNNGRFLSVDPFIQGTDSQAINPYSYIQNNPMSGVDPTGYVSNPLDDGSCGITDNRCGKGMYAPTSGEYWKNYVKQDGIANNGKERMQRFAYNRSDRSIADTVYQVGFAILTEYWNNVNKTLENQFNSPESAYGGLLAMNDSNMYSEMMMINAFGPLEITMDQHRQMVDAAGETIADTAIPYWSCLDGCSGWEFAWSTAELIPFARLFKLSKLDKGIPSVRKILKEPFVQTQVRQKGSVNQLVNSRMLVTSENHLKDLSKMFKRQNGKLNIFNKNYWKHVLPHRHVYTSGSTSEQLNANWRKTFQKLGANKTTLWPWE